MSDTDRSHRVHQRAYELWQQAGCPPGRSEEFWDQASRQIEDEDAQPAPPAEPPVEPPVAD